MTARASPADTEDVRIAGRCMRHFYPKGTMPGDGRICRRCNHYDGPKPEYVQVQEEPVEQSTTAPPGDASLPVLWILPEHSALGASSSERWMNCPGSVALTRVVRASGEFAEDDPDYRRDGTEAHALAAYCLTHGVDAWEPPIEDFLSLTDDMMAAVQTYLDFTRTLQGRYRHVELRLHRPEFHELAYGTLDFAAIQVSQDAADFVDYKHGEGIVVEVEGNPQLQYYAFLFVGYDREQYPDEMTIRLHIVQPRAHHANGPIRTWETRAGSIRRWAEEELRPAMERTANERYLSVGDWCRFCPAKLICPAMACLSDELLHKIKHRDPEQRVKLLEPEALGDWYDKWQKIKTYGKAIEEEAERRVLDGVAVPGVKAVARKSWRVFKPEAPIKDTFGEAGFAPKSVAEIEKLDHGKEFVAEYAFNANDGKLSIAPTNDRRKEVSVATLEQKYGAAVASLEAGETA